MRRRTLDLTIAQLTLALACTAPEASDAPRPAAQTAGPATWPAAGNDLDNTRSQPSERQIGPDNVATLGVSWWFQTDADVWATAAVDGTQVYFPDAAGRLYALDREGGALRWKRKISDYVGVLDVIARSTPALDDESLYLGDQGGRLGVGATMFAVDKRTGQKRWATKIDDHPAAVVTMSPIVYGERVYVGVSSYEEPFAAAAPGYPCCSFRGSMLALDRKTGRIVWKTYTTPGRGFAGAAIWSSTPVVDRTRRRLYVTTGNNYAVPTAVLDCQALPTPDQIAACVAEVPGSEHNHFDAIVALDMDTGKIAWARSMVPFDAWNIACLLAAPGNERNCPEPRGEDYDFGSGAMRFVAQVDGRPRELVGAGQKSGMFWALDPEDGRIVWNTQVGPGGNVGGIEWGSAYDGQRIYVAVSNSGAKPYTLPSGEQVTSGSWAALDPATGKIVWQTRGHPAVQGMNQGPLSVANGIVYAGTIDAVGTMYALDAATGETLWTFASGGSVNTSPAVVDGRLYWGSGYNVPGFGITANDRFYAFAPGARNAPPPPDASISVPTFGDAGVPAPGDPDAVPTWTALHTRYLGFGTRGHCANCHLDMLSAASAYLWLSRLRQIDGDQSALVMRGRSRLSWLGGTMPPGGPTTFADAERDFAAWARAGALLN